MIRFLVGLGWLAVSNSAWAAPAKVVSPSPRLEGLSAAAVLIDEASRDLYVLPPEAARAIPGFQVKPGVFWTGRPLDGEKANETTSPLADRLGIYLAQAQKKLGSLRFDSGWTRDVLDFMGNGSALAQGLGLSTGVWPLPLPYSESSLKGREGLLFVFTCRNADKTGVLNKLDWVRWSEGRVVRSYWSRSLNDPTVAEKATGAIDKVAGHFVKTLKSTAVAPKENTLRFALDKRVSEKEVVAIESVIRGFSAADILLVPYDVNKIDVRYQSTLETGKLDAFIEKLKAVAPLLTVRKVSTEAGIVQILSGPVVQEP